MVSISTLVDRVKIRSLSSGPGAFQLGPAIPAYRGVEALIDGATYSYAVEEGANYEVGTGVYMASTSLLLRTPLLSSRGGAIVSFGANVEINFTALAQDIVATGGTLPIVQVPGDNPTVTMSQKAVTDQLALKVDGAGVGSLGDVSALLSIINGVAVQAVETIAAGDFVNVFNSGGSVRVRRAIANDPAKFANAFAPYAYDPEALTPCVFGGRNVAATAVTMASEVWLSDVTPGAFSYTPPAAEGSIIQPLGPAIPSVGIFFTLRERVLL